MPYKVTLPNGRRGDAFERAIALTFPDPVTGGRIPMPGPAVAALQATYTLIEVQFRVTPESPEVLIDLSSSDGGIRIEPAYPLPDGTTGPAVILRFSPAKSQNVIESCTWDMQFSGPGVGPETWIYGEDWAIEPDVTRTGTDTP